MGNKYHLVESNVVIFTPSFFKTDFFRSNLVLMKENFANVIFPEIEDNVPAGNLLIDYHNIINPSDDRENILEIRRRIFTVDEWAQVLYSNISNEKQGKFRKDSFFNLSYIELKSGKIFAVYALLDTSLIWCLGANSIDDHKRGDSFGRYLFSKSNK